MDGTKRLFLHIGTHKTGSTAIQNALAHHAAALRKEGIVYLAKPKASLELMRCRARDERIVGDCRAELMGRIDQEPSASAFIWSFEGFSGESRIGYTNAGVLADSLKEITTGLDVIVIVYLRRQDDFLESLYTQRIHEGQSYSFETFLDGLPAGSFDWYELLRCHAAAFGKERIVVRRYDKAFLPDPASLVKDFAQIIGSGALESTADGAVPNRGYSRDALEIVRLTNPHMDWESGVRLRRILQDTSSKQPFESYSFWTVEQRREILSRYAASNAAVAREYLDDPSGMLFPAAAATARQPYGGLSLESAVIILAKAIVAQHQSADAMPPSALRHVERKMIGWVGRFPRLKRVLRSLDRRVGQLARRKPA